MWWHWTEYWINRDAACLYGIQHLVEEAENLINQETSEWIPTMTTNGGKCHESKWSEDELSKGVNIKMNNKN